jgi:LCP family protein required for cell wall assembly
VVRRAVTVAVCFAIGVTLAVGALVWQGRHDLVGTRIALDNLGQPPTSEGPSEPQGLTQAQNVLVVGDDSSDDLGGDFEDLAAGERDGHRTDTIMILRIDPQGNKITGINFPRDLYIPLCDGSTQRINAAWYTGSLEGGSAGGAECLIETVHEFADIRIDHYAQVNFEGFVEIVNAVDGVPLYLEEPMRDEKAHVDLPKGCVVLDGRSALGFVRVRGIDNDFGRIARQQRFLKELADRATNLSVLANPVRLFQLVDAVGDMLTVDEGLGVGTMREFALTLRNVQSDDITLATIPTVTDSGTGAYYELPVEDETEELLTAFKSGRLAQYLGEGPTEQPSAVASEALPKIPIDELDPVTVENASQVQGLAASVAERLQDAGVAIASVGDATRPEPDGVVIAYAPGQLTQAQSLQAAAFPDAVLEQDDTVTEITVLLDGDVDPIAIDVVGGEQPEPTPEASRPPRPEYTNAKPVNRDCG